MCIIINISADVGLMGTSKSRSDVQEMIIRLMSKLCLGQAHRKMRRGKSEDDATVFFIVQHDIQIWCQRKLVDLKLKSARVTLSLMASSGESYWSMR